MRHLLDTNIIVAAFRSRLGASHALLRRALTGELQLVMHHKLVSEYRDVLSRADVVGPDLLTYPEMEKVLARLLVDADEVRVRYLWRPNLRDEDDNFIYEIAVAAAPCTIVTHNIRDFVGGELKLADVYVRTPADVLRSFTH